MKGQTAKCKCCEEVFPIREMRELEAAVPGKKIFVCPRCEQRMDKCAKYRNGVRRWATKKK